MDEKEKKKMYQILSGVIGIKKLRQIHEIDLDNLYAAMDMYANRRISSFTREEEKRKREFMSKSKIDSRGHVRPKTIKDYVSDSNWEVDTYGYIYPGIIEITMKNVSDKENPKRKFRQTVSDSYMYQLCFEIYGHRDYEKTDHFDEESLIRKIKKL